VPQLLKFNGCRWPGRGSLGISGPSRPDFSVPFARPASLPVAHACTKIHARAHTRERTCACMHTHGHDTRPINLSRDAHIQSDNLFRCEKTSGELFAREKLDYLDFPKTCARATLGLSSRASRRYQRRYRGRRSAALAISRDSFAIRLPSAGVFRNDAGNSASYDVDTAYFRLCAGRDAAIDY